MGGGPSGGGGDGGAAERARLDEQRRKADEERKQYEAEQEVIRQKNLEAERKFQEDRRISADQEKLSAAERAGQGAAQQAALMQTAAGSLNYNRANSQVEAQDAKLAPAGLIGYNQLLKNRKNIQTNQLVSGGGVKDIAPPQTNQK